MKVIHYLNTAGFGSIVAKQQVKLGVEILTLARRSADPFGIGDVYGHTKYVHLDWIKPYKLSSYLYVAQFLWHARSYDIIHVHGHDVIMPYLRGFFPNKKIILQYHGSAIRGKWKNKQLRSRYEKADMILISTKDLLIGAPSSVILIHIPVDRDIFYNYGQKRIKKALAFIKYRRDHLKDKYLFKINELAKKFGLEVSLNNVKNKSIPHSEMPHLLNRYEYFIDVPQAFDPNIDIIGVNSGTGLQALACGCKVLVEWEDNPLTKFPLEKDSINVSKRLFDIYTDLKKRV